MENNRKCFKCGCSPSNDNVKLFRFPKPGVTNLIRCLLWAKYIFPDREFASIDFQRKLHSEHRMLCHQHFVDTDFTDESKRRLVRTAIPFDRRPALHMFVGPSRRPSCRGSSVGVSFHVFPHPEKFPETFKAWVKIAGGKLETPDDYKYYRSKKICSIHFTDQDKNRNNRLNALAVPTLCLPGNVNSGNHDHIYHETSENSPEVSVPVATHPRDSPQIVENEEPIPELTEETVEECIVEDEPMEVRFSWQQPSAVVPCDSDLIEENADKKISRKGQGTSREFEVSYAGRLKDTGTSRKSETPGHLETPQSVKSEQLETSINTESPEKETPARYLCNTCEQHIHGYRYVCVQCADFDLCAACEAAGRHQVHYVLGVPQGKAKDEVEVVLQTVRRALSNCIVDLTEGEVKVKEEPDQEDPIAVSSEVPNTEDPMVNMEDSMFHKEQPMVHMEEPMVHMDEPMVHIEEQIVHMEEPTDTDMFYNEDPITLGTEDPMVHKLVTYVSDASDLILDLENSTTASKQKPASPQQQPTKPSNIILQVEKDNSGRFIVTSQTSKAMDTLQLEQYNKTSGPRIVNVPNMCVNTSGVQIVTALEQCLSTSSVNVVSAQAQCANPSHGDLKRRMPVKVIGMTSQERNSGAQIVTALEECLSTSSVNIVSAQAQCANPSPGALKRRMPVKVIGMTSPERKKVTTVRLRRLTKEEIKAAVHKS